MHRIATLPLIVILIAGCGSQREIKIPDDRRDPPPSGLSEYVFAVPDAESGKAINARITASNVLPEHFVSLLRYTITVHRIENPQRDDLRFWHDRPMQPDPTQWELRLDLQPADGAADASQFIWVWPEIFEAVRPGVIRLKPEHRNRKPGDDDVGRTQFPLRDGTAERVIGSLTCTAADGAGTVTNAMPFVRIRYGPVETATDSLGRFDIHRRFEGVPTGLTIIYNAPIPGDDGISSPLQILNDVENARSEGATLPEGTMVGDTLDLGTVNVRTNDCEVWRLGVVSLRDYHNAIGASPPGGRMRFKRWADVYDGTPYTFYERIVLRANYVSTTTAGGRQWTIPHEFGHAVRHVLDGDEPHWHWDNFRWAYAREHDGTEIFNQQYAFNEGWAQYWEAAFRSGNVVVPAGVPDATFLDWNEIRIGQRLVQLATEATRAQMVQVLRDNPGVIHSLYAYEQRYCALLGTNSFCSDGQPTRQPPTACPPGFFDDGATCRQDNIRSKPGYGRGVGLAPRSCGAGNEYDAGLCYPICRAGFSGIGPMCWAECPPGYHDDGLTCRRDVVIFASDNSACPWWDVCGVAAEAGCSSCPPGFHNDGCTCRRDADIFGKESYGRGAGWVPTQCHGGREYDAGLCYTPCRAGFTGSGPMCWGECPDGFDDHGLTCYRPPNVLVK